LYAWEGNLFQNHRYFFLGMSNFDLDSELEHANFYTVPIKKKRQFYPCLVFPLTIYQLLISCSIPFKDAHVDGDVERFSNWPLVSNLSSFVLNRNSTSDSDSAWNFTSERLCSGILRVMERWFWMNLLNNGYFIQDLIPDLDMILSVPKFSRSVYFSVPYILTKILGTR